MKKITFILLSCVSFGAFAQKDNVGIGTTKPDPSAALEINSSNKGLLMPRLTLQQRNTIQAPAKGLIVYQTDMLSGFYFYDGEKWQPLSSSTSQNSIAADPNDWTMAGNTVAAGAFLGTMNAQPIKFKVANTDYGQIGMSSNLFFGSGSGAAISSGAGNTGIGKRALKAVTTGSNNIALGEEALGSITSGSTNIAIGYFSLRSSTNGILNVGIGDQSLKSNTSGSYNFAMGGSALANNISGNDNIALGLFALRDVSNTNNNIGIGSYAGSLSTGSNNIFIGYAQNATGSNNFQVGTSPTNKFLIGKMGTGDKFLKVNVGSTNSSATGFLAVGDFDAASPMLTPSGYRLIVQDGILTEKVKVALKTTGDWADYVFEPDYKLMPLEKIEMFIKTNKHLPNVPSAEEMTKGGLDVSITSKMFMEKIEELTLHIIELNKKIQELEKKQR